MDVDTVAVHGEWIRHAPHRSSLLGRATEATDGRWQHGEVVRALYLADEPATAIAEWYRLLAERGTTAGPRYPSRPPRMAARRPQHTGTAGPRKPHAAHARTTNLAAVSGCGRAAVPCGFRRHSRAQRRSPTRTHQLHLRPRRLASHRLPAPENH
jgi:hypothetical protein